MKSIFSLLLLFLTTITSFSQGFLVNNCKVDIYISEKGYFDVVENYDINFTEYKHGIYRTILTSYDLKNSEGKREKRKIWISHIEVPGHHFESPFDFVQKLSDRVDIKIGDKDKTIIGPQHYEIKYRVGNAFLFEGPVIRFYWNIKPDDWYADFEKIEFSVHAPEGITLSEENCFVYSGYTGISTLSDAFNLYYENNTLTGTSKSGYVSHKGDSVTVLINLPEGSVKEVKPLWPFWNDYGWTLLIALLIGSFYYVWNRYGRDDRVISTTSFYPPKDMDPAMAGFLINDREDNSDLIALLPYWGSRGLIRIEELPKQGLFGSSDTKLVRLKPLPENAPEYEQTIFNGLFDDSLSLSSKGKTIHIIGQLLGQKEIELKSGEVLVSSLKNTFYTTMSSARSSLKKKAQPYYEAESKKVQGCTLGILIVTAIILGFAGLFFWGPLALIAIVITCIVLIFLNMYMIKKNALGNRMLSELKGFKRFIKIAEENKLKMLLKDDPGYFENTMGYALAFGLFDRWAKKFDALHIPPPDWYNTPSGNINMYAFSKSFSQSMSSMKSTMVSSPSSSGGSSGGGSSGGGFGGGGGGSW